MSSRATAWAWKQEFEAPLHRLVLLALADMAGVNNDCAWPSVKYLAGMTGCSQKTIMRATGAMAERGLLTVEVRPNRSNLYTLIIEESPQSLTVPPGHQGTMVVPPRDHGSPPQGPPQSLTVPYNLKEPKRNLKRIKEERPDIPLDLNTPEFSEALAGFEEMRTRTKNPLTTYALKLLLAKLLPWGHAVALEALNNSTMNNWKGVFDPREKRNGVPGNPGAKEPTVWEIKSVLDPLKEEAKSLRLRHCAEGPLDQTWDSSAKKQEWLEKRKKIKALEAKLQDKAGSILA